MGEETRVFQKDLFFYEVESGRAVRVFDGFFIGREDCHWNVPNDPSVSRKHLQISVDGNHVYIEDLNSKNKTLLNGKPIEPGMKYLLTADDEVDVGNHKFVFRNQDPTAQAPSAPHPFPNASSEPTPPRVPMIQLHPADQLPPPLTAPSEEKSAISAPVISAELELAKLSDSSSSALDIVSSTEAPPPFATLPKISEKPPQVAAASINRVVPPPPPSRARVKSAARKARRSELAAFLCFKHCTKLYLATFAGSLGYVIWSHWEDLLLAATTPGLPCTQDLAISLLAAFPVAYAVSFFPAWWINRSKLGPGSMRALLTPLSGAAFAATMLFASAQLGYEDASQWNRVSAYCVVQFSASACVSALQASNGGLARLPSEQQEAVRAKLLASSNPSSETNRAPASDSAPAAESAPPSSEQQSSQQ